MKEFIIKALAEAMVKLDKQTPSIKKVPRSISIIDVNPLELTQFMKDNDVPDDAHFDGRDNGYDAFDDILLTWTIEVPTTDDDKLKYRKKRFTDIAWRAVFDLLTTSGYKRVGYSTRLLKDFDDTCVYDMYIAKDFDRLVKYYSLPFKLEA